MPKMNSNKSALIDRLGILAMWIFPLLLIAPNIALNIMGSQPFLFKTLNIVLPLGIYFLIVSACRRTGLVILLCFPIIFYAAFQIVLLYLYGGNIIAVDMLLNVVTTNASEACELLGNLLAAIGVCLLLYLPPLIFAVIALLKKQKTNARVIKKGRSFGIMATIVGLLLLISCKLTHPELSILRSVFPANVIDNTIEACHRYWLTSKHSEMSQNFSFGASTSHDSESPEAYVLIIGETSRADNWQLFGYERPTNPRLSKRGDLIVFPKTLSQSNTTHKSVPMIMSHLDASDFGKSVYSSKSIISAFKEAGYYTAFLSTQHPNGSFIEYFGAEADTVAYLNGIDGVLLDSLDELLKKDAKKIFIVMHTYGSHFNYQDRYPKSSRIFIPDDYASADPAARVQLINAFDNTIVYVDSVLDAVSNALEHANRTSAFVYVGDHGEDIFDDERKRFLHASPTPTYWQLHVPLIVWTSPAYNQSYSDKTNVLRINANKIVSSSTSVFNTLLDMAGISTDYYIVDKSLASNRYAEPNLLYINDYNEAVDIFKSGINASDKRKIQNMTTQNISFVQKFSILKYHISNNQ